MTPRQDGTLENRVERLEAYLGLLVGAVERIEEVIDEVIRHPALYRTGWTAVAVSKNPGFHGGEDLTLKAHDLCDDVRQTRQLTNRIAAALSKAS